MAQEFEILKFNNIYEIETEFPYRIRKIGKENFIAESITPNGYYQASINGITQPKHRLIAFQWIPNDNPNVNIHIDHINRNKQDNRIENLRWVSPSENNLNRDKYTKQQAEYLDEMPDDVIQITNYNDYEFDRYYFDIEEQRLLMVTKHGRIKVVKPSINGSNFKVVLLDLNGKGRSFGYKKLMKYLNDMY
jgi:hypothetical protein